MEDTPTTPGETIGRNVRAVRERQLLSRPDLAERSGVAKPTIAALELGMSARPRRRTIEKLAKALDVPVEHLLSEEPISPKASPPPSQLSLNGLLQEERRGEIPGVLADYMSRRAREREGQVRDPNSAHFRTAADARAWLDEVLEELRTWARWLFAHAKTLLPPAEDVTHEAYWQAILDFALRAGVLEFQDVFQHAEQRIAALENALDDLELQRIARDAIAEVGAEVSARQREASGGVA